MAVRDETPTKFVKLQRQELCLFSTRYKGISGLGFEHSEMGVNWIQAAQKFYWFAKTDFYWGKRTGES
jgi:hypothetical protein